MFSSRVKADAAVVVFILFLGLLGALVWLNPVYDWDTLPYTALALATSSDPVSLQAEAYRAVDSQVPEQVARLLTSSGPDPDYRRDMATNPWHFAEQLPFYSVKPLYVLALTGLHRAGLRILMATRLLSAGSFAVLGIILFLWLRRCASALLASAAACCVLATPEFLRTGALTYPDAFFSALALAGLYLVFARGKLFPGLCLLVLLPLVRSDGLVLVALVLAYLAWKNPKFPARYALSILAVEILANRIIGFLARGYGYQTLFYHSFVGRLAAPAETIVHITLADYWGALKYFFLGSLGTPRPLFMLLGLASLGARRNAGLVRDMAWLGLAYAGVHIVVFPLPESRFLVVPFALFVLWAVNALSANNKSLTWPPN
jgi:hypothetical protein